MAQLDLDDRFLIMFRRIAGTIEHPAERWLDPRHAISPKPAPKVPFASAACTIDGVSA